MCVVEPLGRKKGSDILLVHFTAPSSVSRYAVSLGWNGRQYFSTPKERNKKETRIEQQTNKCKR
jgi:hypothetical protein